MKHFCKRVAFHLVLVLHFLRVELQLLRTVGAPRSHSFFSTILHFSVSCKQAICTSSGMNESPPCNAAGKLTASQHPGDFLLLLNCACFETNPIKNFPQFSFPFQPHRISLHIMGAKLFIFILSLVPFQLHVPSSVQLSS